MLKFAQICGLAAFAVLPVLLARLAGVGAEPIRTAPSN